MCAPTWPRNEHAGAHRVSRGDVGGSGMNEIVVGIDRSETARRAAEEAADLAHALSTTLHLMMCVERGSTQVVSVGGDQFRSDWLSEAEQFLDDVARTLPHDA